ncbi:SDR family NAD(P)-dependent oxidoreductase [Phytohabitans kaempferiae]|uniref:SDR family NAD(P)-dependent oxidoreductase n=1 Tax=Phytohabitans kaempferiae TaxID=1620943 RepID=A0ABV6LYI0_9ACTN
MGATSGLEGKAIVVTGGGRGVGAACAAELARLGARVVVNDVDAAAAKRVAAGIEAAGGQAVAQPGDVSSRADAAALVGRCVDEYGRIDGLFNNAALMAVGDLGEYDEQAFRDLLDVNVVGVANCAAEAIGPMYRQGSGAILNVTSGAHLGLRHMSLYAATKGAVASLTYAWAAEAAGTGVRVNALSPFARGHMTRMTDDYLIAHGHADAPFAAPPPESNAPVVAYLLSDRAAGVHGQVVRIDGTRLSLMAHPAIIAPILDRPAWTADDVDRAFRELLGARQAPVGIAYTEPATTERVPPVPFD